MPDPVHPSLDAVVLQQLADSFGQVLAARGDGFLVHVIAWPDGPEIAVLPLEGQAPAEMLRGTLAPEDWAALGVACCGTAMPLDRGSSIARSRAEVVVLVSRTGQVVGHVRQDDRVFTEPPASGLTLDCLQRALGLPTAPPEGLPSHLLSVIWLERVVRAARGRRQPLRWGQITRLHPAVELARGHAGDPLMAVRELDRTLDWARLRQLVMAGAWPGFGVTPEDAEWFDDGALSRQVLAQWPPLPSLLAALRSTLPPDDTRRCLRLLRRLGVDTARCA